MHDRTRIERCRNSEIGTHILEGKVFELIQEIMLDPAKLRGCTDAGGRSGDRSIARELARIAGEIRALDEERRGLISRYAAEQMAGEAYITANRALDRDLERLTREKAELVAALQSPLHEDFVDASIRQFCAGARARFQACADFDAKRQLLVEHVERVIYNRYKITVAGSIPVQSASGETKLQFRIEGEIDRRAVRSRDANHTSGRWEGVEGEGGHDRDRNTAERRSERCSRRVEPGSEGQSSADEQTSQFPTTKRASRSKRAPLRASR
jgi:hypothetical protein